MKSALNNALCASVIEPVLDLIIATGNSHKASEVAAMLPENFRLLTLKDINWHQEIPETGSTFSENAFIKAKTIADIMQAPVIADDSGLEVEALGGAPGVYSARFAGNYSSDADNVSKLLQELGEETNRSAQFRTVICLVMNAEVSYFEGIIEGEITDQPVGTNGFGYDPIFIPKGESRTFAQMSSEEKNRISHRKRALELLVEHFNKRYA